ncbi:NUDIX hydrolase [Algoriphagus aestuariicola]|jgi:ADP-ribose pyrophosphatase YjhB (NUDIX family)|uniref:NUDIX hydrolase n=1 Tax=Algoriphagus aestuariicola TaxID=1852016 RepID=A0ABS3BN04_9BACT|nr:NUDIX domain-containing protein [Algoriphagus aestuariicola]MBN7800657.1 NUDIX hydrolase [Algoriphagus aestuariicola]
MTLYLAPLYEDVKPLLIAIDCIIFGVQDAKMKLLIFKREVEPLAGSWSLLGSFVNFEESVDEAAERILFELTGLEDIYMEQLHCFGAVNRDPGGRVVSIAYWSLIRVDQSHLEFNVRTHESKWISIDAIPELVLDHREMVEMAISNLRERARFKPIGFELLPQEFTMVQLLKVYEAIFDHPIDNRNFRKKLLKSGLLIPLTKKDKSTSKKGSFLYKFNQETYSKLSREGYSFGF